MADSIPLDYQIRISRTGDGAAAATADLQKLKDQVAQLTEQLKRNNQASQEQATAQRGAADAIGNSVARYVTIGAALGAITSFTHQAIAAAKEHEITVSRLNGTLRATGQYTPDASAEIQKFSETLTKGTRYTQDAATGVQTLLLSFGATQRDLPQLTKSILDLSAGLGIDLHTSALMVAKALEGNFSVFHRYGFEINANATITENLNNLLAQLQQRFGGLATAEGGTLTGRLETLKKDFEELAITIGNKILPLLAPAAGASTLPAQINKAIQERQNYTLEDYQTRADIQTTSRENIQDLIGQKVAAGEMSAEKAAQLNATLASGFEPTTKYLPTQSPATFLGLPIATGGTYQGQDIEKASDAINTVLDAIVKKAENTSGAGTGAGGISNGPSPGNSAGVSASKQAVDEERTAALAKLKTLTEQINDETLQGLDRQDAKAIANFQKRAAEIDTLAHKAGLTDSQRGDLQAGNFDALTSEQGKIAEQRATQAQREADKERLETSRQTHEQLRVFEENLSISVISYGKDRTGAANREYEERLSTYHQLLEAGKLQEDEYTKLVQDASLKRQKTFAEEAQKRLEYLAAHKSGFAALEGDLTRLGQTAEQQFSQRLSSSIVDGLRSGHIELKKFASDFLAFIAQAIIQALILRAIQSTIGGFFGGGGVSGTAGVDSAGSNLSGAAANGTVRYAANGLSTVSGSTYFPRHNVIAGEAGPEVLAVLSKPRSVRFAGRYAAEGMVNGQPVALVPGGVTGLSAGGAGGNLTITIAHSPDVQAQIQSNSIQGAIVQITRDLGKDTPVAASVRRLTQTS